jgi:hypothetical protein
VTTTRQVSRNRRSNFHFPVVYIMIRQLVEPSCFWTPRESFWGIESMAIENSPAKVDTDLTTSNFFPSRTKDLYFNRKPHYLRELRQRTCAVLRSDRVSFIHNLNSLKSQVWFETRIIDSARALRDIFSDVLYCILYRRTKRFGQIFAQQICMIARF